LPESGKATEMKDSLTQKTRSRLESEYITE